ncbi:hypothetical protein IL38_16475 [Actinopolyspora erythraea]|uniref:Uncharacterized protein n=1 Tax=Actinopolyspora erythraea TaxID=414996 RepID=A0ABR4X1Q5_9ACTN|nr:hypothetical protein IL38_16475 [Actinopolyspora erythraea]
MTLVVESGSPNISVAVGDRGDLFQAEVYRIELTSVRLDELRQFTQLLIGYDIAEASDVLIACEVAERKPSVMMSYY